MTETIGKEEFGRMVAGAAARVRSQHQRLTELDCLSGDGDHGTTMLRAMEQLESASASDRSGDLKTIFRDAGWRLFEVDGGASSSLLGTFFSGMSDAPIGAGSISCADLTMAFEAGLKAAGRHTKAGPGDKTMMDALIPAVRALRAAADSGKCVQEALGDAAAAALTGAESTRNLTARYGRAKHLGDKTLGHEDPGAVSVALIFEGFYTALAESKGQTSNG
jgi:dihydroxyacetone kinase-like protein